MINISIRGRAASLVVLAGAGFGSLVLAGPVGAATASPAALKTVKIQASCKDSVSNKYSNYAATVITYAPASVAAGKSVSLTKVQYKVTVPGSLIKEARTFGFTSAAGKVSSLKISASDAKSGTGTQNIAKTPFKFGPVALTAAEETTGLTLSLPAKAVTLTGFVSGTKGTMKFTPGAVSISAVFSGKSGSLPATLSCKPGTTQLNSTVVS